MRETSAPSSIRVALMGFSSLSAEAVKHLLTGTDDITLVDVPWDSAKRDMDTSACPVDVILTTAEHGAPHTWRGLFFTELGVPVIVVDANDRLHIYDRRLRRASPEALLAEIRRVTGRSIGVSQPVNARTS